MPFRPITGLYRRFYNNQPLVNALIKIKPSKNDYDLEAGYPVEETEILTTAGGNLPAGFQLWVNQTGFEGSKYVITEPDGFKWKFVLPPGDLSPISIQELRAGGTPVSPPDTIISLIENTDLGDLHDVDLVNLQSGDTIVWDESAGQFVNENLDETIAAQAVVFDAAQNLTNLQKQQARENIGFDAAAHAAALNVRGLLGLPPIDGMELVQIVTTTGTGVTNLYTVPAGKKAVFPYLLLCNPNGFLISHTMGVNTGGSNYRLRGTFNLAQNGSTGFIASNFCFEAGESLYLQTSGSVSVRGVGLLMPADAPLKSLRDFNVTAVQKAFYTVPAGKCAISVPETGQPTVFGFPNGRVNNDSGASVIFYAWMVPPGETVQDKWLITFQSRNNGESNTFFLPVIMKAGDALYSQSNSNAAGQNLWLTIYEQTI